VKSALSIRKLHLGGDAKEDEPGEPTSYGGSFAASSEFVATARSLRTFNNARPFGANRFTFTEEAAPSVGIVHPPKAVNVVFPHAQRTLIHQPTRGELSGTYHTPRGAYPTRLITTPAYPTVAPLAAPPSRNEAGRQESLRSLLECCQQQSPGCRHLCTPSVSKEQVDDDALHCLGLLEKRFTALVALLS
jgi:hypothetical protein